MATAVTSLTQQSTILYRITMGAVVASAPTVGSNREVYEYKGVKFVSRSTAALLSGMLTLQGLIDLGGQSSLRAAWNQYFADTEAIILVIDSNDAARLALAKAELQKLVKADVSFLWGMGKVIWLGGLVRSGLGRLGAGRNGQSNLDTRGAA